MPILNAETDIFPDDLLDRESWQADAEQQGWALYTRSRREKELMRRLKSHGIAYFGPTVEKRGRTPGGRALKSFVPLFPNYVFMFGNASQRYAALQTNCVSREISGIEGALLAEDMKDQEPLM